MRVLVIAVIASVLALSPLSSAYQYHISGMATYSDGTSVIYEDVTIQCEDDEYDCHPFRGTTAKTDFSGYYEIPVSYTHLTLPTILRV